MKSANSQTHTHTRKHIGKRLPTGLASFNVLNRPLNNCRHDRLVLATSYGRHISPISGRGVKAKPNRLHIGCRCRRMRGRRRRSCAIHNIRVSNSQEPRRSVDFHPIDCSLLFFDEKLDPNSHPQNLYRTAASG